MAVLGGGGGGAGDTYTASTAVAGVPITNGQSYAISSDGKLVTLESQIYKKESMPVPNDVTSTSGYGYAHNIYGDMCTPDGKATFHIIGDDASPYYGTFYISLDGGQTNNGGTWSYSSTYSTIGSGWAYNGAGYAQAYLKCISEDDDNWYYIIWMNTKYSASANWYNAGASFMVKKSDHTFTYSGWYGYWPHFHANATSTSEEANKGPHWSRQSKYFYETCRNGDIFVWTYGQFGASNVNSGFFVAAVDTYRSSDQAYLGGTSVGLPKTSGKQVTGSTHRDNAKAESHMPFFKVDDANGIFIAPYYCTNGTNDGQYVFLKYSIAADHTITEASEVLITGTDPSQGGTGQGHWVATTNPLIYYHIYMYNATRVYQTKCTFNADWTAAAWGTEAYFDIPTSASSDINGATNWSNNQDSVLMGVKHSIPQKELFFLTGKYAQGDNAAVMKFPASGTPSYVGLTTLNNELEGAYQQTLVMQSMNKGTMMSLQKPGDLEGKGFGLFYSDYFNPAFKKTFSQPAIARSSGDTGDTINIDLKTGDTATATLNSDYFLTKDSMSYPLDVEGVNPTGMTTAVKSIQRGYVTSTATSWTVDITKVDVNKAFLNFSGNLAYTSDGGYTGAHPRGMITSPTQITFTRGNTSANIYVDWEVIEYV